MFESFEPGQILKEFLADTGMSARLVTWLTAVIMIILVAVTAWLSKVISRAIIVKVVSVWVRRTKTPYDDIFLESRVFHTLALIVPGVVVWYIASWMLHDHLIWLTFVRRCSEIYIVIASVLTVNAFVQAWHSIYLTLPVSEGRPIKGYVQLVKALVIIAGILVSTSILFRVSVTSVIAGLGVASAALLIVFKDTLLGLVASMQLSNNKMLSLGDWITIPGRNIDGTVVDMSLHTVKVKNFDNTILTVPTYALVSESFQNWKGMEEAGVRRIKREIRIDVRSIAFLDAELLERISRRPLLEQWLRENAEEIEAVKKGETTSLTNLGAFRAYMLEYLRNHENIDGALPVMVRDMPPAESGMPVELYCFSIENQWVPYEAVQSGIFDYVYAVIGQFGLRAFQNISGSDLELLKK
jgi:miniconductance mechanosensitive channel